MTLTFDSTGTIVELDLKDPQYNVDTKFGWDQTTILRQKKCVHLSQLEFSIFDLCDLDLWPWETIFELDLGDLPNNVPTKFG